MSNKTVKNGPNRLDGGEYKLLNHQDNLAVPIQNLTAFTSEAHQTTAATTNGYLTNQLTGAGGASEIEEEVKQNFGSKSHAVGTSREQLTTPAKNYGAVAPQNEAPFADEFRIYDDKAIHGWLEKQGKGYFSSVWKRLYVIVDSQKLCYFADKQLTTQ